MVKSILKKKLKIINSSQLILKIYNTIVEHITLTTNGLVYNNKKKFDFLKFS